VKGLGSEDREEKTRLDEGGKDQSTGVERESVGVVTAFAMEATWPRRWQTAHHNKENSSKNSRLKKNKTDGLYSTEIKAKS